jgi:hypothetical protein
MTATDQKHIEDLGFTVEPITLDIDGTEGRTVSYRHIYRPGHRQVAVYRSTRDGDFLGWGWVEITNGRRDVHTWDEFTLALSAWAPRARGVDRCQPIRVSG